MQTSNRRRRNFDTDSLSDDSSTASEENEPSNEIALAQSVHLRDNRAQKWKARKSRDFGLLWIAAIESASNDLDYALLLDSTLKLTPSRCLHLPPHRPPPLQGDTFVSTSRETKSHLQSSNTFFGLESDGDEDDDDDEDGSEDEDDVDRVDKEFSSLSLAKKSTVELIPGNDLHVASDGAFVHQNRYLMKRLQCGFAEMIRNEAIKYMHDKEYEASTKSWEQACSYLQDALIEVDDWTVVLLERDHLSENSPLRDNHNHQGLTEVLEGLKITRDDTEKKRDSSLVIVRKLIESFENDLNPLTASRDEARKKLGEDKWKSNGSNKKSEVALKRKALFDLREALVEYMYSLESLELN